MMIPSSGRAASGVMTLAFLVSAIVIYGVSYVW